MPTNNPSGSGHRSLRELLQDRASSEPLRKALVFLAEGDEAQAVLNYAELDRGARAIAACLHEQSHPSRAILLFPPGPEFVRALWGCFYASVVAVPAYPPDPARLSRTLPHLRMMASDARVDLVLTTAKIAELAGTLGELAPELDALRWIATDTVDLTRADLHRAPDLRPDTPALLQYTSGSTALPRGVLLDQANILENLRSIQQSFGLTREDTGVIWLPPYHDMGLIGGILEPVYAGFPVVLMPPMAFLERPVRWLRAITRYGGTCSGGPNFAYELCARRISPEEREGLDLSSWQVAFSGAEPVRAETLERFTSAFVPSGFHREAFHPCYGLSEATLMVSSGRRGQGPRVESFARGQLVSGHAERSHDPDEPAVLLASSGRPSSGCEVRVVEPAGATPVDEGVVGEIWVTGPSVARGYWQAEEATRAAFENRLDGGSTYLRTGDLGFLLEGELFVTGRSKDVIVTAGQKHFAEQIEATIEGCHLLLRPGCGAVFSIDSVGEERVVAAWELDERESANAPLDLAEVCAQIRRVVAEHHLLPLGGVVLTRSGSLPKTPSGKMRRQACRALFLGGKLATAYQWHGESSERIRPLAPPRLPEEQVIADLFVEILQVRQVGIFDSFFELGGHSVLVGALKSGIRERLQVDLPWRTLFEKPTVAELAVEVAKLQALGSITGRRRGE
jgi:acyl-CoA synthetase (AMP-forming)/AMP-acid ligase II